MGAAERLLYDRLEAEGFANPDDARASPDEDGDSDSGAEHAPGGGPPAMQLLQRLLRLRRVPFPLAPPSRPALLLTLRPALVTTE